MISGSADSKIIYITGAVDVYYISAGGFEAGSYSLSTLPAP